MKKPRDHCLFLSQQARDLYFFFFPDRAQQGQQSGQDGERSRGINKAAHTNKDRQRDHCVLSAHKSYNRGTSVSPRFTKGTRRTISQLDADMQMQRVEGKRRGATRQRLKERA